MSTYRELIKYDLRVSDFQLVDDGTLDTVILFRNKYYTRWNFNEFGQYRDSEGNFDMAAFVADYGEDIVDEVIDNGYHHVVFDSA